MQALLAPKISYLPATKQRGSGVNFNIGNALRNNPLYKRADRNGTLQAINRDIATRVFKTKSSVSAASLKPIKSISVSGEGYYKEYKVNR